MTNFRLPLLIAALAISAAPVSAQAGPRDDILAGYAAEAGVKSFDPAAGKAFFLATHSGGKPDTPSCSTCHTSNPLASGKTRAGKSIDPMAVSANPGRFTDKSKVEKWFGRNCNSVLGRDCTASEKGNFIAWLSSL